MGTVTHLTERLRTVPTRIGAEDEVLGVAQHLASAEVSWEDVVQSGVFAISIPVDFGGLDVSNAVMAEAVSIIAAASPELGATLASHFSTLEALRHAGSEEQRRAIFSRVARGESFSGLLCADEPQSEWALRLSAEGIGYRLDGEIVSNHAPEADWLTILLGDERGQPKFVLVSRSAPDGGFDVSGTDIRRLSFQRFHVATDAVMNASADARRMSATVADLLKGALALGRLRQNFLALLEQGRRPGTVAQQDSLRAVKSEIGRVYVHMETLSALVQRCGTEIDIAQVTPGVHTLNRAGQVARSLAIAATQGLKHDGGSRHDEDALVKLGSSLIEHPPYPVQVKGSDGSP
ncbi:acyl-CoA dehydrogenase family protein [Rhizobium sp. RU36D]|uniref:acyl-CoA dehydrogenase family protein n=1 Tax=Rhizobium sp. RU36D TaxID=1907415 RepID=UPI0009D7AA11|nr:acyl-CoA dehydrogenase family protein [Rhizobium sp. RU36D]SMD14670.1 Acyl-CoA dehydrogenase [Rhizobium sp. RU36D]